MSLTVWFNHGTSIKTTRYHRNLSVSYNWLLGSMLVVDNCPSRFDNPIQRSGSTFSTYFYWLISWLYWLVIYLVIRYRIVVISGFMTNMSEDVTVRFVPVGETDWANKLNCKLLILVLVCKQLQCGNYSASRTDSTWICQSFLAVWASNDISIVQYERLFKNPE